MLAQGCELCGKADAESDICMTCNSPETHKVDADRSKCILNSECLPAQL